MNSANKLVAMSLIVGPVLSIVFFLLEPGGLLIDRADSTDAVATITALASNAGLTHLTAFVIPLGLIMALYGLSAVQSGARDKGSGDALSRLGFLFLATAFIGWIISEGLTHRIAGTQVEVPQSLQAAAAVYSVESSIALMSSLIAASGFLIFSLGLAIRGDFNKIAALVVAAVSVVAAVCLIIGMSDSGQLKDMLLVARICYFFWVVWMVLVGVELLSRSAAAPDSAEE